MFAFYIKCIVLFFQFHKPLNPRGWAVTTWTAGGLFRKVRLLS